MQRRNYGRKQMEQLSLVKLHLEGPKGKSFIILEFFVFQSFHLVSLDLKLTNNMIIIVDLEKLPKLQRHRWKRTLKCYHLMEGLIQIACLVLR